MRVLTRYADVHAMLSDPRVSRDPGDTGEQHQLWRPLLDLAVPSAELVRRAGQLTGGFERVPVVW